MLEEQSIPFDKLGIPLEFAKFANPNTPKEMKIMVAKGVMPIPPKVLMAIQYCFVADKDKDVSEAASSSLMGYPSNIVVSMIDDKTHPKLLDFFAFKKSSDELLLESILFRRQLSDNAICFLAKQVPLRFAEMLAQNQERLLETPALFYSLKENPHLSTSVIERMESFLRMHGVFDNESEDLNIGEENLAFSHGYQTELDKFSASLIEEPEKTDETAQTSSVKEEQHEILPQNTEKTEEAKSSDLWSTISRLSISKKIKLAYFGNSAARSILVRDPNKMVSTCVVKNPRLTESELVAIAKNKNVCDDVLREIARNKQFYKIYSVKVALANNPKCPTVISVPLISHLMIHDVKSLSGNRNVPGIVSKTAKESLNKKSRS